MFFWLYYIYSTVPLYSRALIIYQFNLPRILLDILCGSLFALAGTFLQACIKNPLGSPEVMGISTASVLSIAIALSFGFSQTPIILMLCAFLGALIAILCVFLFSYKNGHITILQLILMGSGVALFTKAVLHFLTLNMPPAVTSLLTIIAGSSYGANWHLLHYLLPIGIVSLIIGICFSYKIKYLYLGDVLCKSLGINILRLRISLLLLVVLLTALASAGTGNLGFVGLVAPNIARLLTKRQMQWILLYAIVLGALFVLFADALNVFVFSPTEIPVGLITIIIGTPYFIWLLRRSDT